MMARSRFSLVHEMVQMFGPSWSTVAQKPFLGAWSGGRHDARRPSLRVATRWGKRTLDEHKADLGLTVEFAELPAAEAIHAEWQALVDRALEPNIFAEPAFALAAARHFAEAQRPLFVLVRDRVTADETGELLCVWPIDGRQQPLSLQMVRSWCCAHAVLGAPTIDRNRAAEAADAVFDALAARLGAGSLILVPQLPKAGPTYGLLVSRALATGRTWGGLSPYARAVLPTGALIDLKRSKELARKRRRLEERGAVTYRCAETADDVRDAIERFLVIESSGWKGRRATALLSDAGSVTFARSMLRQLAHRGECRIDSLEFDGRPIAMGIVLNSGSRAYFWKIAFDEAYATFSPGLLLAFEVTRRQLAEPTIKITDSCAVAGHPMIERVWNDRQDFVDLALAISPAAAPIAKQILHRESLRRSTREWTKRTIHAVWPKLRALRRLPGLKASPASTNAPKRKI